MRLLLQRGGNINLGEVNFRRVDDGHVRVVTPLDREHAILTLAKRNKGVVTPSEAALEAHISLSDAQKKLDEMCRAGHAQMRVRKSGSVVYTFPEFMDTSSESELENF
jgi:hypothetical protein